MGNESKVTGKEFVAAQGEIETAINQACKATFGVLDTSFLCRSVSVLEPRKPLFVKEADTLESVLQLFQNNKIGCVLIVDGAGKLSGIFSERDVLLRILPDYQTLKSKPISEFMTKDPVSQPPDATIGFVLNLMSAGGFRHVPIVDPDNVPIGIVSVKNVVDFIVKSFTDDLLAFTPA